MKILAIEKEIPGVDYSKFAPHITAEALRAWELIQANVLREIYREQDAWRHVLVFECATLGEAQAALDSLPLVREGLIAFELIALGPYPGFARLFAPQS